MRVVIDPAKGVVVTIPGPNRRGWARPEPVISGFLGEREAWLRRHLARQASNAPHLPRAAACATGRRSATGANSIDCASTRAPGSRRSTVTRVGGASRTSCTSASRPRTGASSATSSRRGSARAHAIRSGALSIGTPRHSTSPRQRSLSATSAPAGAAPPGRRLASRGGWCSHRRRPSTRSSSTSSPISGCSDTGVRSGRSWRRAADHPDWRRWLREHALELHGALGQDEEVAEASA